MSLKTKSFILIFIIVLIDQILKIWIKTTMMLGDEIRIFDWFIIHFVENPGMAFGMEFFGKYGKLFLSVFRIVAVTAIGYYLLKMIEKGSPVGLIISISMILAGAVGNILDSAFYGMLFSDSYSQIAQFLPEGGGYASFLHGKVVDMFYFPLFRGSYPNWMPFLGGDDFLFFRPVFNIADSSITLGIFSIILCQKKFFKES